MVATKGARSLCDMIIHSEAMEELNLDDLMTLPNHLLKPYIHRLRHHKAVLKTFKGSCKPADFATMIDYACLYSDTIVQVPPEVRKKQSDLDTELEVRRTHTARWTMSDLGGSFPALRRPFKFAVTANGKITQSRDNGRMRYRTLYHWISNELFWSRYCRLFGFEADISPFSDTQKLEHEDGSTMLLDFYGSCPVVHGSEKAAMHARELLEYLVGDQCTLVHQHPKALFQKGGFASKTSASG